MAALQRALDLNQITQKRSHFLLGPRQTGKTHLIRSTLDTPYKFNLLDFKVFNELSANLGLIRDRCRDPRFLVVIDEIQKLPELLDEVQLLMEERKLRFLLTGSSARKLKKGGTNLLGGRARVQHIHPLIATELGPMFQLDRAINCGLLPSIYLSDEPDEDLSTYIGVYLSQEVAAEGLTRNIPAFSRFLEVAALCHSKILNHSKIASDAQIGRTTVQNYFEILYDTLIAFELKTWSKAKRRKSASGGAAKFYLFDNGIARKLQGRGVLASRTPEYGDAFEAYVFHEIKSYIDYMRKESSLNYWRSDSAEVDFIINGEIAVEAKSADISNQRHLEGLNALRESSKMARFILVNQESEPRRTGNIEVIPYHLFTQMLWTGEIF